MTRYYEQYLDCRTAFFSQAPNQDRRTESDRVASLQFDPPLQVLVTGLSPLTVSTPVTPRVHFHSCQLSRNWRDSHENNGCVPLLSRIFL